MEKTNNNQLSIRYMFITGLLISAFSFIGALFLENFLHLSPCPLCIIQRVCLIFIITISLIAISHNPKIYGYIVYSLLVLIFIILGIVIARQQIYIQNLPPGTLVSCGADIKFMFNNLPFSEFVSYLMEGSADCAKIQFNFLGLTLPKWSFILFVILLIIYLWQLLTCFKSLYSKKNRDLSC